MDNKEPRISVPVRFLTELETIMRKQISITDRHKTLILKMKKRIISLERQIAGMKRRQASIVSTFKRIKAKRSLKPFVSALKKLKMSIRFQSMHVKQLARLLYEKDVTLDKTKQSYNKLMEQYNNVTLSLNSTTQSAIELKSNTTLDQTIGFGDVTIIKKVFDM